MRSETLYLRLPRARVALFRFLLEGWDNLALFTSLGQDAAGAEVLCLRFAPRARAEVRRFLDSSRAELGHELLAD